MDHHPADSGARHALHDYPAPLRLGRRRAVAAGLDARARRQPRRAGADRRHPARGRQGAPLRPQPRRRCARGLREHWTRPATNALRGQWDRWGQGVALVVLESPYRSLMEPLLEYIEQIQRDDPSAYVTVILPEFVPRKLVAAPAAQPARAAHQGRAAVQAERRRDERAVPPRPPRGDRGHCRRGGASAGENRYIGELNRGLSPRTRVVQSGSWTSGPRQPGNWFVPWGDSHLESAMANRRAPSAGSTAAAERWTTACP